MKNFKLIRLRDGEGLVGLTGGRIIQDQDKPF
jgi:hypothetical protein